MTSATLQRHCGVGRTFVDAFVACLFGEWHRMNCQNICASVAVAGIEVRCRVRSVSAFTIFSVRSGGWASRQCLNRLLLTCRLIGVKRG